ncbi:uncharacterized protein DNG_07312 [Cephalotrichum gorgonifer]|uniref:DUF7136 domain-containing protein n=1 Tax=Cephalotrichum gorgonifer TaxID=2041049 RepID=A0AAE8N271_9PEZI|nr:uncharacterized protein DNG_07312 [Cephalotrichum gorgonifer]
MRLHSLLLAAASTAVTAANLPTSSDDLTDESTTITFGLVHPKNNTYNNITGFPVLLAVHNAEAAFDWGWSLSWTISGPDSARTLAVGSVLQSSDAKPPAESVNNVWVIADTVTNATVLEPGKYRLDWLLKSSSCSGNKKTVTVEFGVLASGGIDFSIVDDGSGRPVSLTDECPVYQDRIVSDHATQWGCPLIAADGDGVPDTCALFSLDDTVEKCVLSNLTGEADGGACAELRSRQDTDTNADADEDSGAYC